MLARERSSRSPWIDPITGSSAQQLGEGAAQAVHGGQGVVLGGSGVPSEGGGQQLHTLVDQSMVGACEEFHPGLGGIPEPLEGAAKPVRLVGLGGLVITRKSLASISQASAAGTGRPWATTSPALEPCGHLTIGEQILAPHPLQQPAGPLQRRCDQVVADLSFAEALAGHRQSLSLQSCRCPLASQRLLSALLAWSLFQSIPVSSTSTSSAPFSVSIPSSSPEARLAKSCSISLRLRFSSWLARR